MSVKLERQTSLSIQELVEKIKDPNCAKCFYINEIGTIFVNNEDGKEEAMKILLKLLKGNNSEKFYACCYLSLPLRRPKDISEALRAFRENPKNSKIVKSARESIRQRREE